MKRVLYIFVLGVIISFSTIVTHLFIYAMPDYTPKPLASAIVQFGAIIVYITFLSFSPKQVSKVINVFQVVCSFYLLILTFNLALLSIYSLDKTYAFAAAVFLFDGCLLIAGFFYIYFRSINSEKKYSA